MSRFNFRTPMRTGYRTIRVPEALAVEIEDLMKKYATTRSEILKQLIKVGLEEYKKEEGNL